MIFCIIGKSATGKDTILKKILSIDNSLNKIVLYTTRPKRDDEVSGNDYYFVDEKYLKDNNSKIIEKRVYNTIYGLWYYATIDDGNIKNDHNYIMITTLEAYNNLKKYFGENNVFPIYLEIPNELRRKRAIARENIQKMPKYEEMNRRFEADEIDFSEENIKKSNINKKYNNEDIDKCLKHILEDINKYK